MFSRRRISAALIGLLALVIGGWLVTGVLDDAPDHQSSAVPGIESGLQVVELSTLPPEAGETYQLIQDGGPFPYLPKDGSTFFNREGLLPERDAGYYQEFTVPTPGATDRGARRLVTGADKELYYTADHYQSFVVVDPNR